jgi:hypothetical protein
MRGKSLKINSKRKRSRCQRKTLSNLHGMAQWNGHGHCVLLDEATILDLVETTKSSINPRQLPLFSLGSYFKDIFVGLSLMGKV